MLSGTLAKQFEPREMEIQLAPLTEHASAELILDEVVGLDPAEQQLHFAHRESLHFDAISIGVGSMPAGWNDFDSEALVPIKPMQTFIDRLETRLDQVGNSPRCVIVGGGVAGVEIALCLHSRLVADQRRDSASIAIATSGGEIVDGMSSKSRAQLEKLLADRSIKLLTEFDVSNVASDSVEDASGNSKPADVVIWATGAAAPPILSKLGLPTDERGFLATKSDLRTTPEHPIFALGDSGTVESDPAPKAGVYTVRQAPVPWHNLRATFDDSLSVKEFHPQDDFLKIMNTGEGKALLEYNRWTFHARWCWWLKCWIDKSFVAKYQH